MSRPAIYVGSLSGESLSWAPTSKLLLILLRFLPKVPLDSQPVTCAAVLFSEGNRTRRARHTMSANPNRKCMPLSSDRVPIGSSIIGNRPDNTPPGR
jgi:hypothetical protein